MRAPDLTIGPPTNPQTYRWHLWLPKWLYDRGWRLNLHRWLRSDDDRALHDHRGDSVSVILWGGYYEITSHAWEPLKRRWCFPGCVLFRRGELPHRVELREGHGQVWTLWLRWPFRREWGFWCRKGWMLWSDYMGSRANYYQTGVSQLQPGGGCND
jgi:hypothetical protein